MRARQDSTWVGAAPVALVPCAAPVACPQLRRTVEGPSARPRHSTSDSIEAASARRAGTNAEVSAGRRQPDRASELVSCLLDRWRRGTVIDFNRVAAEPQSAVDDPEDSRI